MSICKRRVALPAWLSQGLGALPSGSVSLWLPGERPVSWNKWYSGRHWSARQAETERVGLVVRGAIDPSRAALFDRKVDFLMVAYETGNLQDSGNPCSKPYLDALINWYIREDDTRYVRWVASQVVRASKREPAGVALYLLPVA